MKQLFLMLLKKYSKESNSRIEIHKILDSSVSEEYTEQSNFGNIYNGFEEFILGSRFVNMFVRKGDMKSLEVIKSGIIEAYDRAIDEIQYNIRIEPGLTKDLEQIYINYLFNKNETTSSKTE